MKIRPRCPRCGSHNVSCTTTSPLLRRSRLRPIKKQYPENAPPGDKFIRPAADFNHTHYCNTCSHYFGGGWGG